MNKLIGLLLTFSLVACSPDEPTDTNDHNTVNTNTFIKAAHYFGDTWPITFWQEFELDKVDADLTQIKNDGFNTVILVVPWRGFESGFDQPNTISDPKMYQRLALLLQSLQNHDLSYMLRLGYTHDYSPAQSIERVALCANLYENTTQAQKWQSYLKKIHTVTQQSDAHLVGVFISWEDFWCSHNVFPYLTAEQRKLLGRNMGYPKWLMNQDPALLTKTGEATTLNESDITVPTKDDPAYLHYLQFVDEKFNNAILSPVKQIFPQASIEIRVDKAQIKQLSGKYEWVGHDLHLDDPNHRGTYWAPFWGAVNKGEKLTAKQALFNFERFLKTVTNQGASTNHVIEQFNFFDNTPQFPNNANIIENEIDTFLIKSVPLLKKYSAGYGVWAYRDYTDNALYNASFEFGLKGWDSAGHASIIRVNRDQQLNLPYNSHISQSFNPHGRFMLVNSYPQINFCLASASKGEIGLSVNDILLATHTIVEGKNCFPLPSKPFQEDAILSFKLEAKSDLIIDELNLSGFTQLLGLYDELNQPGPHIHSIRKVNTLLDDLISEPPIEQGTE
jgi:hypothetical protein